MNQAAERIESIKAGLAGAAVAAVVAAISASGWLGSSEAWSVSTAFQIGVAGFSGFLFAVTYRHIIRTDRNSHLKSGAVLAFALVRGLAQVETQLEVMLLQHSYWQDSYWQLGGSILTSLLLFAAVALLLDYLIQQGWLKQFEP
jgi:hypothetical protein